MPLSPESPDLLIDTRGHRCPTPTLRLRRALEASAPGATLRLLADDPLAKIDIPHFLRQTSHVLLEQGEAPEGLWFRVQRA